MEVPTSVEEAYKLDKKNNNTIWRDAIKKEMTHVSIAFHILDQGEEKPVGYEHINCNLIFDVKMDFRRKDQFVAVGHRTNLPEGSTYAEFVSQESVRIAFLKSAFAWWVNYTLKKQDQIVAKVKALFLKNSHK